MATQLYDLLGPTYPFGRGSSSGTITSDVWPKTYCSGSSGAYTLSIGSSTGFSNGDLILIHQTRGTSDAANWQVNQIISGATSSTWTLKDPLIRTYTNQFSNSASKAQVVKILEYSNLTMGTFSAPAWKSTQDYATLGYGGICPVAVTGVLTISGIPNLNGKAGFATSNDHGVDPIPNWYTSQVGGGFRGGWNSTDGSNSGAGEGYTGQYVEESTARHGNGAGGSSSGAGAGGGHAAYGSNSNSGTLGGTSAGDAALSRLWFGGGGSGAKGPSQDGPATGGNGGGIWVIWAKRIVVTGGLRANGGAGGNTTNPPYGGGGTDDGGGGAGGAILINCETADLGNSLVTATGGTGNQGGGTGSVGRIRINYGRSVSGSTNPSASVSQNGSLISPLVSGGIF